MYSARELAVGDLLGDGLHDVRADGIGSDDVVSASASTRAGLATGDDISVSPGAAAIVLVSTAIVVSFSSSPWRSRRGCRGDRAARVQILPETCSYCPGSEAVRPHMRRVAHLRGDPRRYVSLSFRHLPLAGVVVEGGLVHHRDAVLHWADRLADAAAAAGFHVGVVEALWGDVEAGVRALEPAESALHARVEVDDRPHGAGENFLKTALRSGR